MADVQTARVDGVPAYEGEKAIPGIRFRPTGRALGVTAWGMNVIEIDAGCTRYPEHDHAKDGQEEVYVVLDGDGTVEAGGERTALTRGTLVRVGPSVKRKFLPGPRGIVLLALGATPRKEQPEPFA
jgi:mannose-6-phosphate isomerase-like protein (cupin superfamily)